VAAQLTRPRSGARVPADTSQWQFLARRWSTVTPVSEEERVMAAKPDFRRTVLTRRSPEPPLAAGRAARATDTEPVPKSI
jgi:hypothetical protein